ncbi:MAG: HipA domain-containing protein, partial [Gammaproteobacteria bacterium]|nr:HipA domain-containing protein [Gammaproteobacteria bacterium]
MASLYVYMNGYEVGEYSQPKNGPQTFIYSDSWLERRGAVPISLSLPLTEKSHRGDVVYNFFDNLLPDSLEIRNRIQSRFGIKTNQAFDLLSTIGRDCAGAIQLLPEQAEVNVKTIEGTALNEEQIANELRQYKTLPLGMSKDQDFRISLAGAQEKTAFLWHNDNWMRPIGTTPSTHIFKLPIGKIEHTGIDLSDSVENEWLCLEILKTFGLPVAEARIETFEDMKVLVVKRFDREIAQDKSWIIRHPVEDICQALGVAPALKYESDGGPGIVSSMKLLASSIHAQEDRFRFMQSVFLFWMLGA